MHNFGVCNIRGQEPAALAVVDLGEGRGDVIAQMGRRKTRGRRDTQSLLSDQALQCGQALRADFLARQEDQARTFEQGGIGSQVVVNGDVVGREKKATGETVHATVVIERTRRELLVRQNMPDANPFASLVIGHQVGRRDGRKIPGGYKRDHEQAP